MKLQNITFGTDPEIFLQDKDTLEIVSSIGIIKGSKHTPFPIGNDCYIQTDNILTEFCIPACTLPEEIHNNINYCLQWTNKEVEKLNLQTNIQASAFIDTKYLNNPQALEFGCDPDYNAWLQGVNKSPNSQTTLRSCGGHLHIGYNDPNPVMSEQIVKTLDLFLGVASMVLDKDTERRKLYGTAGSFRFKPYGVEYRVLSNFWIADIQLITWLYNQTHRAISFINEGNDVNKEEAYILKAVNENHMDSQKYLIEKYELVTELNTNKLICAD